MQNLIEELRWRGLIQDIVPGTEEQLLKEPTTAYVGFDPTAESLHIGSLIQIILLMHLQQYGHKPLALVGGATGMVGDPSGKSEERNLLSKEVLEKNIAGIRRQLSKFLDFESNTSNAAEMVNNLDWFQGISFIDFIRDAGKHISVNYMMAKDSVKKRLEAENGMSFTEFCYQLMQGYDFYWLREHKECKLQFGGSDQWGNIVTGTELIRRKSGKDAFAFTCPLLKKADGGKFGKTESGTIWLDAERTSPYQFYQFWLNTTDADVENFLKIFTFLSSKEIAHLVAESQGKEHLRPLQKRLAAEVTRLVHSEEDLEFAQKASSILFSNDTADILRSLTEKQLLQVMEGVPGAEISKEIFSNSDFITILSESGVFPSKGEARKMLQAGGISMNKRKVNVADTTLATEQLLHDKYLLIQKGKKNYFLIQVTQKI